MSTKIYNGFKIDTGDICEVQNILMLHHSEIKEMTEDKTIDFLINYSVRAFDKDTINKKNTTKNYLSEVGSDLLERQRKLKNTQERDPEIDFQAEIVVIPFEGKFYGVYYTEKNDFLNKLLEHPKVSEYEYWDNTDRPDEITAKEWRQRQKIWDGIFKGGEVPCEIGFSKKFNTYIPYPEIKTIVEKWEEFCPSFEDRLKHWTVETYTSREMSRRQSEVDKGDYSSAISLYLSINRDKSEYAKLKKEEIKKELEDILLKEIKPESINVPFVRIQSKKLK